MCIKALNDAWKSKLGLPSVLKVAWLLPLTSFLTAQSQEYLNTYPGGHTKKEYLSLLTLRFKNPKWVQLSSVGTYTRRADPLEFNIRDGWTRARSVRCDGCYGVDHSIHNRLSYCSELRYNNLDTIPNNTNKSWYFSFLSLLFQSMGRVGALGDMYWRGLWTREKVQDKEATRNWTRRYNLWACCYSSWSSRRYYTEYLLACILHYKQNLITSILKTMVQILHYNTRYVTRIWWHS